MVNEPMKVAHASGRRRNVLNRKLVRDMTHNAMQFIAMMLLCFLGTWCFSGLDAAWRSMDVSYKQYFSENNAADLWVKSASFSKLDMNRAEHISGVKELEARSNLIVDCPDLGDDVSVNLIAYQNEMGINIPYIQEGEALQPGDTKGILVEEQFANAQGLKPGDSIMLDVYGSKVTFVIRGLVLSPEYIFTSNDVAPDAQKYGFVLANHSSISYLPYTELVMTLEDSANIEDVKIELEELLPGCLIQTKETNGGISVALNSESMYQAISYLFPVMVYAVAAMIVVSTLKRMIENQRVQLGTLKALGFAGATIRQHYLVYALIPSLAGSLIGLVLGRNTLTNIIWGIVLQTSRMPYVVDAPISFASWISVLLMVGLSLVVCNIVYSKAAVETTANLLRPKPPRSGSRILLERWEALWVKLTFNTKMVIRNIFRNKGRSFLSFVGIFCCNMLIVCSLCLTDSIPYFVTSYFYGTHIYDVRAELDSESSGTIESYQSRIHADVVEGVEEVTVSARSKVSSRACSLTILEDDQTLYQLGENQTPLEIPTEGICASEKLCKLLSISLGDEITIYITGDEDPVTLTVTCICDTNIGQGVYLTKTGWENLRKGKFMPTALLIKGISEQQITELENMDEVTEVKRTDVQCADTLVVMQTTSALYTILLFAALGLAFVICYNMGLMNFTERIRDYATLKVLGYHQKEISMLLIWEQIVIAGVATALSIYPGMLLTDVILLMSEYEDMVFTSCFKPGSIALACVITMVFAFLIQLFLTRKVKGIDMVQALKSVE